MLHRILSNLLLTKDLNPTSPPSPENWQAFLHEANTIFNKIEQEKALLEQSLDISSSELQQLFEALQLKTTNRISYERDMFTALFQHLPDSAFLIDEEGFVIRQNAASEKLFGYTEEELLGQSIETIFQTTSTLDVNSLNSILANGDIYKLADDINGQHNP